MKFVDTPESKSEKKSSLRQNLAIVFCLAAVFASVASFGSVMFNFALVHGMSRAEIVSVTFGVAVFGSVFGIIGWMLNSMNVKKRDADQ